MYGILIDVTRCTACEKCVGACTEANDLNPQAAEHDRATTPDGLSDQRLSTIMKVDDGRFARKACMHCMEPSCVSACLVGGLTKSPEGPVVYDADKCIGCRYCMLACPFHIPRYEWHRTMPFMVKCNMCVDRLAEGRQPACTEACPEGALLFGQRDELLQKAQAQIKANPRRYQQHVWGETEFGGTSVMYISDVDLAALGWPTPQAASIPSLTEPLVHKTPFIGLGVAVGLIGLNWIVKRRNQLATQQQGDHLPPETQIDQDGEVDHE
ncbi:4Fe-4S dicluster domain-containing protein [candidate division GN15 bacterium]|nr:4Fe-4S dicluster domain-containing protein [candidate division GN15 bacterium]